MKDVDNTLAMRILSMGLDHIDHSFLLFKRGCPLSLKKATEQPAFFVQGTKYRATRPILSFVLNNMSSIPSKVSLAIPL